MKGLKDIKSIVEIPDISLYILIGLIIFALFIVVFFIYKYKTRIKKSKQKTKKEIALEYLKNLDYLDVKDVAYSFSTYGYIFLNEKNKEDFENLEQQLEKYKYKKEVKTLNEELKTKIQEFIGGLRC